MCSYCAHGTRSNPFIFCSQQSSAALRPVCDEILADNKYNNSFL